MALPAIGAWAPYTDPPAPPASPPLLAAFSLWVAVSWPSASVALAIPWDPALAPDRVPLAFLPVARFGVIPNRITLPRPTISIQNMMSAGFIPRSGKTSGAR
jgi:hypothetical protein